MSSFAPVYRLPKQHQSFLTREHERQRKRKRATHLSGDEGKDAAADSASPAPDLDPAASLAGVKDGTKEATTTPRVPHPVNNLDPYYVAGLSREEPLPRGTYPHARVAEPRASLDVEQELARLNPPLYLPHPASDTQDGSFRRRHLDNLTAILHRCMLNRDWDRASRVWGLILRTEINGRGVDIRRNDRWLIGAEILMRRTSHNDPQSVELHVTNTTSTADGSESDVAPAISDEGFRLAREYFERLILQYPHLPRQSRAMVSALAFYPALFNVWVFGVQDRALRARRKLRKPSVTTDSETSSISDRSDQGESMEYRRSLQLIAAAELEQATPITERMDDVMRTPPYDESRDLLYLRSMVSLWLYDICNTLMHHEDASSEEDNSSSDLQGASHSRQWQGVMEYERSVASKMVESMLSVKMQIPHQLRAFVEEATQRLSEDG